MDTGVAVWLTDQSVGIVELAPAVETAGCESLFLVGHTHVPTSRRDVFEGDRPGDDARLLEQFTALGAAAACTSTLLLGTGVCVIPQFDPILLAKQVATVDQLSGGRFLFGVGAGWLVEEIANHGVDPATRWERMDEQLQAMKAIWRDDEAEFHGRFVDFDPIWCWPKPVQRPHPPLLVGGDAPRSLGIAARHGDAWAPVVDDLDEFERGLERWHRARAEAGAGPAPVTAFVEELDAASCARFDALGVSRVVVNLPLDDGWRERLDGLCAMARPGP
jgi:probable F420-dependent oxidoreductase